MKPATIQDVAFKAGVSKTTVSHVINATRFVEPATRQKVLQAIEECGYRPSSVARSLTTKRTQTIGVIVSDITNTFFGEILRGIEEIVRAANYSFVVCNTDEILEREEQYIDILIRQRVDGIIAAATSDRWEALIKAKALHVPIILLDRRYGEDDFPFVGVNNEIGASLGARHLIEAGYTRIGILSGFQRLSTMRDRLAGFLGIMHDRGLQVPEEWIVDSPLSIEAGYEAARKIISLSNRPQALFINNNLLSLGTLLALHDLGLRCPEDIALIGFDDHPWAAVSDPPLTVVSQPVRRLGRDAAALLMEYIQHDRVDRQVIELSCELVIRQSCCLPHKQKSKETIPQFLSEERKGGL